ncbi:MAG: energy transducer TonB [Terracidiphilus sp.]|jgi:TonB family protein
MPIHSPKKSTFEFTSTAKNLSLAAALALVVTFSLSADAAENRAIKSKVAVIYPQFARRMKVEGVVNIEATVDASGKVKDVKAIRGNPILAPAAEDAVRQWTFEPGTGTSKEQVEIKFGMAD